MKSLGTKKASNDASFKLVKQADIGRDGIALLPSVILLDVSPPYLTYNPYTERPSAHMKVQTVRC